jgi:hypothetical protein
MRYPRPLPIPTANQDAARKNLGNHANSSQTSTFAEVSIGRGLRALANEVSLGEKGEGYEADGVRNGTPLPWGEDTFS